jgi:2-keto-4-pentenoate hydratase/2-oxohepta-3-ene-1,7-dioic acid hydratase in catechol pathway
MIFSVPELVARLSEIVTLLPGDLIFTGTPAGVGASRTPVDRDRRHAGPHRHPGAPRPAVPALRRRWDHRCPVAQPRSPSPPRAGRVHVAEISAEQRRTAAADLERWLAADRSSKNTRR